MKDILESKILGEINAEEIILGKGVVIEKGVVITGKNKKAKKVKIGDFAYIGENTRIIVPEFSIGDYSKLHSNSFCYGEKPLRIGRNCWIGGNVILDSIGGLDIDDNVGIGAQSQIWTHIKFGDIIEGSRFNSEKYMHIKKDAWFVGHCIVSPVKVEEKSMAMVGSVITKDMEYNTIYAGVPAINISEKIGYQFNTLSVEEKLNRLQELINSFEKNHPHYKNIIRGIAHQNDQNDNYTWLNVSNRTYNKKYEEAEILFFKENIPLIKFTPFDKKSFIFE